MIIGIDGNEANTETKVGVHQMAFELIWKLSKLQDTKNSYTVYLKSEPRVDMPPENKTWKYKVIPGKRVWVLTKLMPALFRSDHPDVFFTPSHYIPIFAPIPRICMITDLGYLEFTGQFRKFDYWQLKVWTAISIMISKHIIAISETTKKDIVRHYPFASKKITVAYLGANSVTNKKSFSNNFVRQILNKYRITKNYIAFVSTLKPGKNIEGLVEAFSKLKEIKNYQLVISGKKGWLYESIFTMVKKLQIEGDVVFTDYVTEDEKRVLIENAKVFVLPSHWEGFGIDVLNSFAVGTPVVVSNIPSLIEVTGDAGVYVDPKNVDSISNGIEEVINMNTKEYNRLVAKGYIQLKKFDWVASAQKVAKVLDNAYLN